MPEYTTKEKKSFREIVLVHLEKILEISTKEFRGGFWKTVDHGNWSDKEYIPDQRKCFIQAIEIWSDVLAPHFTKDMKEDYKDIEDKIKDLVKEFEEGNITEDKFVIEKMKLTRKLFQKLNFLLYELKINLLKKKVIVG